MGHSRISFAIIGGGMMIAKINKITNHALVEVGEVVVSEGISIKSCGIGASFKQGADLVAFEAMIVIGVVEATRSRRRNSRYIGEGIRCWWTVSG